VPTRNPKKSRRRTVSPKSSPKGLWKLHLSASKRIEEGVG
jgi:hypothetical protein